jgi:hypothetical protein
MASSVSSATTGSPLPYISFTTLNSLSPSFFPIKNPVPAEPILTFISLLLFLKYSKSYASV